MVTRSTDIEVLGTELLKSNVIESRGLTLGLEGYMKIQQTLLHTPDVANSQMFQELFRKYYGMRFGNVDWQKTFFGFLQQRRATPPSFEETLALMAERFGRCEPSFSSKLAATLNPELPVLDSRVLLVLAALLPERGEWKLLRIGPLDKRLERATAVYHSLSAVISLMKTSPNFRRLFAKFDARHGAGGLTQTKKLDLILWQYRQ